MNSPVPAPAKPIPFPAWLGWSALAAAASFALIAATFRIGQSRLASRARLAEQETRLADAELRATRNQLAAERILAAAQASQWQLADAEAARLREELAAAQKSDLAGVAELRIAPLAPEAGQPADASGVAVWNPVTRQGVLTVSKLPVPANNRDYQLGIVDPRFPIPVPVDGGVFSVDPDSGAARVVFKTDEPIATAAAFAVSLERKGGAPAAEGPRVLVGK
jgi:hypothetical protein